MCTSSDSSEGHSGSFQIWGLLKYVKRSWWPLGHTSASSLTSGSPQWERAGGTCIEHLWWCWTSATSHRGCGLGQVWCSAEALWLCSSQRAPAWSGALLLLCHLWQRDNFHFSSFLSDILHRCEMCSWFLYEKGKNTLNNWSYIPADPTRRCPYQVLWWMSCKNWKTKNLSLFFQARKLVPSFSPFVVELSFSEIIDSCIFGTKALGLLLSWCALLSSQDVVVLFLGVCIARLW